MLQNIKNNHTRRIDAKLYNGRYYDFMLYKGECVRQSLDEINDMAIADFSTFDIASGILYSTVTWTGATNGGVDMEDIGLTGMDNGLIKFDKYTISNKQFLELFLNSNYHIDSGDTRFFMTPVTGNTLEYKYPMYLVNDSEGKYLALHGGFYQGFVKAEGFDYQVLPINYNKEYLFHFELRPRSDYEVEKNTINESHSANTGIFFFIGARAENKFWPFYKESSATTAMMKQNAQTEGYFDGCGASADTYNIFHRNVNQEGEWLLDEVEDPCPKKEEPVLPTYFVVGDGYFSVDDNECVANTIGPKEDEPVIKKKSGCGNEVWSDHLYTYDFQPDNFCGCSPSEEEDDTCPAREDGEKCCGEYFQDRYFDNECEGRGFEKAVEDEFVGKDAVIDTDLSHYEDSDGHSLSQNGYYEFETDNKFLLFDKTESGFTTENWVEGTRAKIWGRQSWPNTNLFLLMNKTPTGYTTDTIESYYETHQKDYDIFRDIRNNVFALRITEDGAIGYRYGVLNCDEDNENRYEVKEEYSKPGIIKYDKWNTINIRFAVINPAIDKCDTRPRKMRMMVYVNGFLVFISRELDTILLKALDEVYQKQEAVPYNMSLGGGSIGLMETILPDYFAIPEYILPIERDFCGSFLGDIKSFKIYEGFINYSAIADYLS